MSRETTIRFDTAATEGVTVTGEMDGDVLRTKHNARPDFELNGDTVTLIAAKADVKCKGFGTNLVILDG